MHLVTYIQEPLLLLNQSMSYVLLIKVRATIHSAMATFCNQVEVFKSTIQNGLRSICECLKINPDAHISEQEVVCVIISGIKALQLKYSLELKTNTQLKNDNETLIIAVNNQKLMRNILPMKIKKLKDKTMIYIKLSQCWIGELGNHEIESAAKRKNYKVEFLL